MMPSIHTVNIQRAALIGLLCLASLLALFSQPAQAQSGLIAGIDRSQISLQDTFTLTLRALGHSGRGEPDFGVLQQDFEVLGSQRSNQMRVINNQMESWTEWRLTLAPKRAGLLTIPALTLGNDRSTPLTLTVQAPAPVSGDSREDIFIELELDKERLYVQEQLLFTVRLYTSVSLRGAELEALELPGALVVPVAENRFQRTLDGRPHGVIETTFAVFPQQSGELVLPSLSYNLTISAGQRDLWGNLYSGQRSLRRLRTEERRIPVRTIPAEQAGQPWLPARQLRLSEHWSTSPTNLRVGEPVTRTLTLSVDGLSAGQLPPLQLATVEGLSIYSDQPQTDEQRGAEGVSSQRLETFALVPQQSGELTLPAISVNWWNTATGQLETAHLPATRVQVQPAAGSFDSPPAPRALSADASAAAASPTGTGHLPRWWWLSQALLTLIAAAFALLYYRLRTQLHASVEQRQAQDNRDQGSERAAWSRIKRAGAQANLNELRSALIQWGRLHWQQPQLARLQELATLATDPALSAQLQALDAAIWSQTPGAFDPGQLLPLIQQQRQQKRDQKRTAAESTLAPLYPQG